MSTFSSGFVKSRTSAASAGTTPKAWEQSAGSGLQPWRRCCQAQTASK